MYKQSQVGLVERGPIWRRLTIWSLNWIGLRHWFFFFIVQFIEIPISKSNIGFQSNWKYPKKTINIENTLNDTFNVNKPIELALFTS